MDISFAWFARKEIDIEVNVKRELEKISSEREKEVLFNKDALDDFLAFALSPGAIWAGNFRDLSKAIVRMATLCEGARIRSEEVKDEIARLQDSWREASATDYPFCRLLLGDRFDEQDLFDLIALEGVLEVCRNSKDMADAGRKLYAASRGKKKTKNDTTRIKNYLGKNKFQLSFDQVQAS